MKKAVLGSMVFLLPVFLYGCVLSVSPDPGAMVVMNPGETQLFEMKTSGIQNFYRTFTIMDISGGEPQVPVHLGDFSEEINDETLVDKAIFTPDLESAGIYQVTFRLKAWADTWPALDPILASVNRVHSRTWKVMVRGLSVSPKQTVANPPGETMTYTAKAYPEGDYAYQWTLDGKIVGDGDRFDFSPAQEDGGAHLLTVTATQDGEILYTLSREILVPTASVAIDAPWAATRIQATPDNGFVVATHHTADIPGESGHGDVDGYILKFDAAGMLEWRNLYGGGAYDTLYAISPLADGGYIASGGSRSEDIPSDTPLGNGEKAYLIRINDMGEVVWQKRYDAMVLRAVSPTADMSGFIAVGLNQVMLLDENGDRVWMKSDYTAYAVAVTPDNGCIILGKKSGPPALFKLDALGNELWSCPVEARLEVYPPGDLISDDAGGAVVILNQNDWSVPHFQNLLVKIDPNGICLWTKTIDQASPENAIEFCSLGNRPEGGYWAVGSHGAGAISLLETDASGNLIDGSPTLMGGSLEHNGVLDADATGDGKILLAYRSYFPGQSSGNTKIQILKLTLSTE